MDAPDEAQLKELGAKLSSAIFSVHGSFYTNQKSIGLYPTTGSADDWFYSDDANENNGEYRAASYTIKFHQHTDQIPITIPEYNYRFHIYNR